MSRRFYLYLRNGIFYAKIVNPETGQPTAGKSTGKRDRDEATAVVIGWLKDGIPTGKTRTVKDRSDFFSFNDFIYRLRNRDFSEEERERIIQAVKDRGFLPDDPEGEEGGETFVDYLLTFWDYGKSPYVQDILDHGGKITRRYAEGMKRLAERHYKDFFKDTLRSKIRDEKDLLEFSAYVSTRKKLDQKGKETVVPISASTKNRIIKVSTIALNWETKRSLRGYQGERRRRGILSDEEIGKLFTRGNWGGNEAARLGNLFAMQSGLRSGEVLALQVKRILEDRIKIEKSWSDMEGLKGTKTDDIREVPILQETRRLLLEQAKRNPWGFNPDSFVFFSLNDPNKPMRGETLLKRLYIALESIGIKETERKARGICFHSWRHFYARKMADVLGERTAKLTGHATPEMLEHYANHADEADFQKARKAATEVFGRILDFPKASGEVSE